MVNCILYSSAWCDIETEDWFHMLYYKWQGISMCMSATLYLQFFIVSNPFQITPISIEGGRSLYLWKTYNLVRLILTGFTITIMTLLSHVWLIPYTRGKATSGRWLSEKRKCPYQSNPAFTPHLYKLLGHCDQSPHRLN